MQAQEFYVDTKIDGRVRCKTVSIEGPAAEHRLKKEAEATETFLGRLGVSATVKIRGPV
jgi:hypothetical protein